MEARKDAHANADISRKAMLKVMMRRIVNKSAKTVVSTVKTAVKGREMRKEMRRRKSTSNCLRFMRRAALWMFWICVLLLTFWLSWCNEFNSLLFIGSSTPFVVAPEGFDFASTNGEIIDPGADPETKILV